jgi:hypothetical protein
VRAFPFILVVAMLGAVSLATVGAVSTVTQNRHNAFSLTGGSALARGSYRGSPARSGGTPVTAAAWAYAGSTTDADGWAPLRTTDR